MEAPLKKQEKFNYTLEMIKEFINRENHEKGISRFQKYDISFCREFISKYIVIQEKIDAFNNFVKIINKINSENK